MKTKSVIKKFEKAGATIEQKNERLFVAKFEKDSIEFIDDEGEVDNFYVIGNTQKDDITSDYFPGRFARNASHAIGIIEARK